MSCHCCCRLSCHCCRCLNCHCCRRLNCHCCCRLNCHWYRLRRWTSWSALGGVDAATPASCETKPVSLAATFRAVPGFELPPWARPWVTLWKFRLTSPSDADIRVTPCLAPPASPCPRARVNCPLAAWRGAESPDFGTMICWMVDARGRPCSIGLNVPVPLNERPGLPCAKAVATCPGITCATWPDLKSATSTCPLITSMRVLAASTETRNCVPLTTAAR